MNDTDHAAAAPGRFYAIGIGPGAPDLLTLRAARLIATADCVLAPRSEKSETSLALQAVRPHLRGAEVLEHVYPMTREEAETRASWRGVAETVAGYCRAGRSVAHITLGDPLIFSTCQYMLEALEGLLPPERIRVVPGISAFQAGACRLRQELLLQEDRMAVLPGTDLAAVEHALDHFETVVLFKASRKLPELRALLARKNLLGAAKLACYVEMPEKELLLQDLTAARTPPGYMAVLYVRTGRRSWDEVS